MQWWLPHDEGYPRIIRSIRRFVEERTSLAKTLPAEDLRDMKAIFASLKLDDGKSSIPPQIDNGRKPSNVTSYMSHNHLKGAGDVGCDAYGFGCDDGQGFCDESQSGGALEVSRPAGFP